MANGVNAQLTSKILGLPLKFTANTDPMGRCFFENYLCNANIVNIVPGKPAFRGGDIRAKKLKILNSAINTNVNAGSSGLFTDNQKDIDAPVDDANFSKDKMFHSGSLAKLLSGDYKEKDLRFYSFTSDFSHFHSALNVLFQEVGAKMTGLSNPNNIKDWFDTSSWGECGIPFWIEGTSQCSESFSNEIGESQLAAQSAQTSDAAREAAFLTGKSTGDVVGMKGNGISAKGKNTDLVSHYATSIMQGTKSALESVKGFFLGGNGNKENAGDRIQFPKMWRNSSYDKSYNLSFRFISPYGDPESVFHYVYAPFLILLALALPKQHSADSFGAPPLLRIDCPGNFSCDMGMVSSLSFQKGTSQELWSSKGFPLGIDVTLNITDMYSSLSMPVNYSLMKQNIGMMTMLDNMCGLNIMQANIGKNLKATVFGKFIRPFANFPSQFGTRVSDILNHIGETFSR